VTRAAPSEPETAPRVGIHGATRALVATPLAEVTPHGLGEVFLDGVETVLSDPRTGLMLLDETTYEFRLALTRPPSARDEIEEAVLAQIDSGAFARAVQLGRPLAVLLDEKDASAGWMLLLPLVAGATTPGMGVAIVGGDDAPDDDTLAALDVLATLLATRLDGRRAHDDAAREIAERLREHEEYDRLNLDLEKSIFQLRSLEQLRDDLTRMIVHDLRTPMTSIKTTLDLMAAGLMGVLKDDEHQMVEIAKLSSDRLLGMISDLLNIAKIEAGEMTPVPTEVDLTALATGTVNALRPLTSLERKGIEIMAEGPPVVAQTDPDLVRRVIENLLGNALLFSPPGSTVTVSIATTEESIELAVRDRGEGIPPEYLDRIFERFVQVEGRQIGRKLGTGLGLTFCRLATDALGGAIRVESEHGKGSTFTVTLPRSLRDR
jgi:signal transduction histidine kinase